MLLKLFLVIFTFVELNCENLFDTEKDPVKNDYEFTESSLRHWDKRKYYEKINNIGKEIISCASRPDDEGEGHMPDIIALCEVENDSVMVDLTRRTMLWSYHYEYLITHSPDERGINTALVYNLNAFKLLDNKSISVELPDKTPTRDILYAKGVIINQDTLHVFVVHSPSRRNGERETRSKRLAVAKTLINNIKPLLSLNDNISNEADKTKKNKKNHIIIAGDFNDYSGDKALKLIEECGLMEISKGAIGIYPDNKCKGTYFFNEEWNSLDHIFTSVSLLDNFIDCYINNNIKLLEPDNNGNLVPNRSYKGYKYNHGFSDHLPLIARFDITI